MLVGSVILGSRVRINDLPRTISSPGAILAAAPIAAIGSTLQATTYYIVLTFLNNFGETIATTEASVTLAANQGIQITAPLTANWLPGATSVKAYFGLLSGQENQWQSSTVVPFTISTPGNPGVPPTRNTSFYPDADGQRVSAYTIYQWLNESLDIATNICGGIPDMTAMATINTQTMYQLIGTWGKFDHGWVDGYIITLGGRNTLFYRNVVPGVVRIGVLQQVSNKFIIELQPQPNRSGGVTTSIGSIGLTDTTIPLTSTAGYLLPFGLAIIGNPPDPSLCEVISFSAMSGGILTGVIRGMGGTVQQAWPAGTTVTEGNIRLAGLRSFVAPNYAPGNSLLTLAVPSGWSVALMDFIVSRYREAEGNIQEANRLMQSFTQTMKSTLAGNKLVAGPRQIALPGEGGMDTVPGLGGIGGGVILP